MTDTLVVFKDRYIHKGKEYFFTSELKNKLGKILKREFFIMDEEMFIKTYSYNGKNIESFIEEKIQKDFIDDKELLYHYEEDKKNNKVYLYALRGRRIEDIINAKVKITPIAFLIKDIVIKSSKSDNFIVVVDINKRFYIIVVEGNKLVKYEIIDDIDKVVDVLEGNTDKKIFVDINNEILKTNHLENKINVLEKINEKIYKKQKFFT